MSSFVKYRIKEVAADFGVAPKEISAIVEKYFEKPKSTAQVLEENQLNLIFDLMTQRNQIESIEVVFAAAFAAKEAEEKRKAEEAAKKAAEEAARKAEEAAKQSAKPEAKPAAKPDGKSAAPARPGEKPAPKQGQAPAKEKEPQRKRERRVVDTSAVQVNADRFDDCVGTLIS